MIGSSLLRALRTLMSFALSLRGRFSVVIGTAVLTADVDVLFWRSFGASEDFVRQFGANLNKNIK